MNTKTFTPKSTMKIYTCLCLLFLAGYLVAQNNTSALLPMPNQITSVKETLYCPFRKNGHLFESAGVAVHCQYAAKYIIRQNASGNSTCFRIRPC